LISFIHAGLLPGVGGVAQVYQQLGLTESLEAPKQRATRTKELAFQRAFGTSA
jgi:hypothetical protein